MSDEIPTPEERPGADVVLYDGLCPLCAATIRQLAAWDRRHRLAFLPYQDPAVTRRWPFLDRQRLQEEVHLITATCKVYRGAEVIRALSRRIPRLWPLAPLVYVPGSLPLWHRLYQLISRSRHLLGRRETCPQGTCPMHRGGS